MKVKKAEPIHIMIVYSGGSTMPRPMPTPLSGNLFLVAMRVTSMTSAAIAPHSMPHAALTGMTPQSLSMPSTRRIVSPSLAMPRMTSAIADHCTAPIIANFSVAASRSVWPLSGFHLLRKRMKKSGVLASAPATMPMMWPQACWRGFAPSM